MKKNFENKNAPEKITRSNGLIFLTATIVSVEIVRLLQLPILGTVGPVNVRYDRLIIVVLFVASILMVIIRARAPKIDIQDTSLFVLVSLVLATWFWSINKSLTLRFGFDFLFYLMFYISIRVLLSPGVLTYKTLILCIQIYCVCIIFIAMSIFFHFGSLRVDFIDISPNQIVKAILPFYPVLILDAMLKSKRNLLVLILIQPAIIFVVFASQSRSGFLALLCAFIFTFMALKYHHKGVEVFPIFSRLKFSMILLVFFIGGSIPMIIFGLDELVDRLDIFLKLGGDLSGLEKNIGYRRLQNYILMMQILSDNWMFGIGYGAFKDVMSTITESWEGGNAHNVFLRFWIGCGFLGLLVVSVFFCIVLQRCFYIENNGKLPSDFVIGRGFSCGFLLLLIMGQFNGISTMFLFYALPGFVGVWYHQLSGRLKVTRS